MALPVLVLHVLNTDAVGFYRAAAAISVTYLGFVTNSMSQDYYPRVSAMGEQNRVLCQLINEQYRMVLYSLLLIILMLTRPQGIFGSREISLSGLFPRRRKELKAPLT